jgi:DNA recombination protein RmuC
MEIFVASFLAAVLGAGLTAALVRARRGSIAGGATPELRHLRDEVKLLGERVSSESSAVAHRLEGIDSRLLQTQSSSTNLARDIFDTLADVRRATDAVADQAREFSALQNLLRAPTARGGVGEAMLQELLRQVLPPQSYSLQHRFRSGTVVDAVVKAGSKLVCIDSKFPLANYRTMCSASDAGERAEAERRFGADVDRHIQDIARRYIIPDEETFDFAVMYVPAEGVYAEVLRLSHRRRPLFELAIEARVMPMSPLTMYGYLETILFGLKCLRIEASAQEVVDFCGRLQADVERFATEYETLGRHLVNARSKYEEGQRRLDRFRGKLERVIDFDDDDRPPLEAVAE